MRQPCGGSVLEATLERITFANPETGYTPTNTPVNSGSTPAASRVAAERSPRCSWAFTQASTQNNERVRLAVEVARSQGSAERFLV